MDGERTLLFKTADTVISDKKEESKNVFCINFLFGSGLTILLVCIYEIITYKCVCFCVDLALKDRFTIYNVCHKTTILLFKLTVELTKLICPSFLPFQYEIPFFCSNLFTGAQQGNTKTEFHTKKAVDIHFGRYPLDLTISNC